ncbi:hypothetical protein GCM10010399_54250 [Dactylosporangium fulvum]|uniref:Uncharacterized protein n=1 Tax=Dactylosporangium fulvum TaxID=53359 RepID=A0ABY5WD14_9ACTN|nr:hypothetical protein [Dactylosporangium fulvum]UWP87214.1 hypothetical protein Dfulv_24415 [Dactylosporangium fulvum]
MSVSSIVVPSPVEAFGRLLDRSIEQMASISVDARDFDAQRISTVADVWDNSLLPFVRAATAGVAWHRGRLRRGPSAGDYNGRLTAGEGLAVGSSS